MAAAAMSASSEGARVAHSAYRSPSSCLLSARLRTSPGGSRLLLAGRPEGGDRGPGHDRHLDPALLVVRRPGVGGGQVVVRRDHAADQLQRLGTEFAGEDLVLADAAVDAGERVLAHTATPHI